MSGAAAPGTDPLEWMTAQAGRRLEELDPIGQTRFAARGAWPLGVTRDLVPPRSAQTRRWAALMAS